MAKKRWHVYLVRGPRGMLDARITNEIDHIASLYAEPCRDRTAALAACARLNRLPRDEKTALIASAARGRAHRPRKLPGKLYQVRNDGFVCAHCGAAVYPTEHDTPRNHCPFCLYSLHVDIQPGDRENPCRGQLEPIGIETSGKKGYVIVYRCASCGEQTRAKAALASSVQPDDFEKIVALSRKALKKSPILF